VAPRGAVRRGKGRDRIVTRATPRPGVSGWIVAAAGAAMAAAAALALGGSATADTGPCAPPVSNPILCENSLPGTPASEWDIVGAGDPTIQGFATEMSVAAGETVRFKIDTDADAYRVDVYRLGWYGGLGARKVATVTPSAALPQIQPNCLEDDDTGLHDCGNWAESASWDVPTDAVSGVYVARPVREDDGGDSHIVFVVRDDAGGSDLLFQTADTTWQAYNRFGGSSLYVGSPANRAYKVSYNRPFTTRSYAKPSWLFSAEYPLIRWLERNGYDVSYTSGVDTARRGAELLEHEAFLSVGHDEYWSADQRANVETARAAGVHLAFFSGNEVFWKTRWESSIDGGGAPFRTLVSYKETQANAKIDPNAAWTGTWRDPRFSPPSDGGRPENALTGQLFTVNSYRDDVLTVPAEYASMRFWRNTSVASLDPGETASFPAGVLGHEWDEDVDNGHRPAGLFHLSSTTVDVDRHIRDHGNTYGPGRATHHLTLYRHASGALVFGAGTVQWAWGLDETHDQFRGDPLPADARLQQATVNLFADMGAQPGSLQLDLVAASASGDTSPPESEIVSPAAGAVVERGAPVTISGTATDPGVGVLAAVEISTDGGATWRPASGKNTWTYSWTPTSVGSTTIVSRAVDDSGNIEPLGGGTTVVVVCPCTIWPSSARPQTESSNDTKAVELGVRFRADRNGYVVGLRFYKGFRNTGTHVGTLWSAAGAPLARATFTGESATGWQELVFDAPVAVTAGATYVASYFAPVGGWSVTPFGLAAARVVPPLEAQADGGIFRYTSSPAFPNEMHKSSNYWVDVVFHTTIPVDTRPPAIVDVAPADGSAAADPRDLVTATFDEAIDPATVDAGTFELRDGAGALVPAAVTYSAGQRTATLAPSTPLQYATTYTATLRGGPSGVADRSGNRLAADRVWTFATAPRPVCPCSLWSVTATPATLSSTEAKAVELGVKLRSDLSGWVTAIRYYRGVRNTGTHVVSLWTSTGVLLGRGTETSTSPTGWVEVPLDAPVAIASDTTYVASYFAPVGGWSVTPFSFTSPWASSPLRALRDGAEGGNGLYRYAATPSFPNATNKSSNYFVDVVFRETLP
jgi:Domain of unknown function (DUF4082)/Bacterial Ig-like domain/Bacterial Ig domain